MVLFRGAACGIKLYTGGTPVLKNVRMKKKNMDNKRSYKKKVLYEMGIFFSGISMSLLINASLLAFNLREQILLNFIIGGIIFFLSLFMLEIASRKKDDAQ